MTNGNDLVEYEERNYDELVEAFIKENRSKWDDFVQDSFSEDCRSLL